MEANRQPGWHSQEQELRRRAAWGPFVNPARFLQAFDLFRKKNLAIATPRQGKTHHTNVHDLAVAGLCRCFIKHGDCFLSFSEERCPGKKSTADEVIAAF